MKLNVKSNTWWGPPRNFSTELEDRKVSWLELFYDLVYVIAIAQITHQLAAHVSPLGLIDYMYFFAMIFWGWLNGSLYHDLHASSGLRTRLMTLWQMLIIAALVITLESPPEQVVFNVTIVLMVMQLYITYLWWSVGFYDKYHRKLNKPYTIIYLLSLALMGTTLFLKQPYIRLVFFVTLLLNYLPPFATQRFVLNRETIQMNLSASMSERLGLFTIIVFGEVITGVIGGVGALHQLSFRIWMNFGLAVMIVFALWWLFFTLTSDRPCKPGFVNCSLLEILYIPTLIGLGLIGMALGGLFGGEFHSKIAWLTPKTIFGSALCLYFVGIAAMMYFLDYPSKYMRLKKRAQAILLLAALVFLAMALVEFHFSLLVYLLLVLGLIIGIILLLNYHWYVLHAQAKDRPD